MDRSAKQLKKLTGITQQEALKIREGIAVEMPNELRKVIIAHIGAELRHRGMGVGANEIKYRFEEVPGVGAKLSMHYQPFDAFEWDKEVYQGFIADLARLRVGTLLGGKNFTIEGNRNTDNEIILTGKTAGNLVDGINRAIKTKHLKIEPPPFSVTR